MDTNEITFLVFTYNEERRLKYMMDCIHGHGDIVVIDNFSSDNTRELASHYTERIFTFKNPGYVENEETMNFALEKVRTKWVYLTYVDELIPRTLMAELLRLSRQGRCKVIELYRKNFMYGQEVFNYGKHHLRMFMPGTVDFKGNVVHRLGKYLVSDDEVYKVPKSDATSLWHFSSYNTSRLELAHNRYADLEARQRHEMLGQKFSGVRALWKLFFYFWGTYLGLGGVKGGWPGLFISVQIAYFKFSIEARLWEKDRGITAESIESTYDLMKQKLIDNGK